MSYFKPIQNREAIRKMLRYRFHFLARESETSFEIENTVRQDDMGGSQ